MSSIMDLIGPELSELFTPEYAKIAESDFVYTYTSKRRRIITNHGHNIYDNGILGEFDYGSYLTVTSCFR